MQEGRTAELAKERAEELGADFAEKRVEVLAEGPNKEPAEGVRARRARQGTC